VRNSKRRKLGYKGVLSPTRSRSEPGPRKRPQQRTQTHQRKHRLNHCSVDCGRRWRRASPCTPTIRRDVWASNDRRIFPSHSGRSATEPTTMATVTMRPLCCMPSIHLFATGDAIGCTLRWPCGIDPSDGVHSAAMTACRVAAGLHASPASGGTPKHMHCVHSMISKATDSAEPTAIHRILLQQPYMAAAEPFRMRHSSYAAPNLAGSRQFS
jgi:hypothetical protein